MNSNNKWHQKIIQYIIIITLSLSLSLTLNTVRLALLGNAGGPPWRFGELLHPTAGLEEEEEEEEKDEEEEDISKNK